MMNCLTRMSWIRKCCSLFSNPQRPVLIFDTFKDTIRRFVTFHAIIISPRGVTATFGYGTALPLHYNRLANVAEADLYSPLVPGSLGAFPPALGWL